MYRDPENSWKIHFEPSTIETIDRAVLNYIKGLELFADTNTGWREVPVIWGTAERAYQVKNKKDIRDSQGMLILPLMTIERKQITKDMASKGVFQGNVYENSDEQGGALTTSRVIYQEKTMKFANADSKRLHGQLNFPRCNGKVVYKTVSAPMPVNVSVGYEVTIRTEYQQQMNDLLQPFITSPGTINYITLLEAGHRYEGFVQPDFSSNNNLGDFSTDERRFESKITLNVVGYLVGQGDNREKPHYSIRENAVEVKIPRERISLQEVPEWERGGYYGLAGFLSKSGREGCPPGMLLSNVPAINSAGTSGEGGSVNIQNFSQVMSDNFVVREVLKAKGTDPVGDGRTHTTSNVIRPNTELLFRNGLVMAVGADFDYTVSNGNKITLDDVLVAEDSLYVTYIIA